MHQDKCSYIYTEKCEDSNLCVTCSQGPYTDSILRIFFLWSNKSFPAELLNLWLFVLPSKDNNSFFSLTLQITLMLFMWLAGCFCSTLCRGFPVFHLCCRSWHESQWHPENFTGVKIFGWTVFPGRHFFRKLCKRLTVLFSQNLHFG